MTSTDATVRNLLDLSAVDFKLLIEKNLERDDQPRLWEMLLHPHLVRRTHAVLTGAYRDVEDQLAERRADMEGYRQECHQRGPDGKAAFYQAEGEHQNWRRRALGYRRIVNRLLREAKAELPTTTTPPRPPEARKIRHLDTVFRLAWAIQSHRNECLEQGIVPDEHDIDLWRSLDQIAVETAADGQMSVAQFLAYITSQPDFEPPLAPPGDLTSAEVAS